jgi:glucose/arabinose dehydrogenase
VVRLEPFVQLEEPIALATRRGDDTLYIAERVGRVRAVIDGQVGQRPVLDISDSITVGGEQGLLGVAFSLDGNVLYVSYTNIDGDSRVDAYPVRRGRAVPSRRRELLAVEQPYANHNGGNVLLGPDGMLYVGFGDGGAGGDPQGNAQNPQTLLGKLVRLDPRDGFAARGNPFVGDDDFRSEIFALGLRNPWRFSFDRTTGDLWIGDVGQDSVEEVDVVGRAHAAGANFGWDLYEGSQPFEGTTPPPHHVTPVIEYETGADGCAVTGGYVYRGTAIPALRGAYVYSDFCGGWIRAVRVHDGKVVQQVELAEASAVASFGEDADGELYVLSLDGPVYRIVAGE